MNVNDTLRGMELCALAYKEVQPQFPGMTLEVIDDENGVQCYLRRQGDTLFITFRGSYSAKYWNVDLTFFKTCIPYDICNPKIRVHSGFLNAYKRPSVRNRIHCAVTSDVRHVRVAGHSYGAALAVLCAVDLEYHYPCLDYEVLLFGCPRVGNRAFRKSYNKRVFKTLRVENGNDIVTKVPPALWGFRHVGVKIHVGAPRLPGVVSLNQHRPQYYVASLFRQFLPQGLFNENSIDKPAWP